MNFSSKNLFSIILIISVVFILYLSSPVYKSISGEGGGFGMGRLIEGLATSANGLTGDGTAISPYVIPAKLIVRPADANWKQKIVSNDTSESGITQWTIDKQFMNPGGPNFIGDQYQYFAEWWLAKYNPSATIGVFYAANVRGKNTTGLSDYGLYKFVIMSKSNGNINYSGSFNNSGWGWSSPPLSPAPAPIVSNVPAAAPAVAPAATASAATTASTTASTATSVKIPDPTPDAKAGFSNKKCNNISTRDGNCIPVCVPISGGKVVGPPTKVYGGQFNALGADGLPYSQNTANYFYEMSVDQAWTGTPGKYYPITDSEYSRIKYGSNTDCTQNYACSPSGAGGSDGAAAQCNPAAPPPSGGCDPSCTKVTNPYDESGACTYNKDTGYTCLPCPKVNGKKNCRNRDLNQSMCGGCGPGLMNTFKPDWQPDSKSGPSDKPYTPTECQKTCRTPGVNIFQNYLNTFRDGAGFDDGSCQIIGRNMIKCRPVNKSSSVGTSETASMTPVSSPDECVLCKEKNLQGYATFKRKWDGYAKQNDYVDVKIVDGPSDGGDGGDGGGDGRRRGAKYGPSSGDGGGWGSGGGSGWGNWGNWDGGSGGGGGWRGNGGGGWYQSLSDVKNKSFKVAALNAESNRQQAYIESLKLELNKVNDDYTTQQMVINKAKAEIDKMETACITSKSKLNTAMLSSVSDDMNKNAAITMKEKNDASTKSSNIAALQENVKMSCDNATQLSNSYNSALKQLEGIDVKRQALIEKLVIAMNSVTDNKTTININLGGGAGSGMGDCGDRLGCGTGINYNNMYTNDYFKPQRIDDMINNVNVPMPYQDLILF